MGGVSCFATARPESNTGPMIDKSGAAPPI